MGKEVQDKIALKRYQIISPVLADLSELRMSTSANRPRSSMTFPAMAEGGAVFLP